MKKLLFKAMYMYITNPCEKSEQKVGHLSYWKLPPQKKTETRRLGLGGVLWLCCIHHPEMRCGVV